MQYAMPKWIEVYNQIFKQLQMDDDMKSLQTMIDEFEEKANAFENRKKIYTNWTFVGYNKCNLLWKTV